MDFKKCTGVHGCNELKPLVAYRKNPKRGSYYSTCIECERKYKRITRAKHRSEYSLVKVRDFLITRSNNLKTKLGIVDNNEYKDCDNCKEIKETFYFNVLRSNPDGLQNLCKKCMDQQYRKRLENMSYVDVTQKICNKCHLLKDICNFAYNSLSPDKHKNICNNCIHGRLLVSLSDEQLDIRTKRLCKIYGLKYIPGKHLKKCPDCILPLPLSEFSNNKTIGDGKAPRCSKHNVYRDIGNFHGYKTRTHKLVRKAIAKGYLIRPKQCAECLSTGNLHGHHDDYSKPLDVRWLCKKCHALWHKNHKFELCVFDHTTLESEITKVMIKYYYYFYIGERLGGLSYIGVKKIVDIP